jgi:primosomal protein N' (replication factor Y) (superfamily II helicase)
MMATMAAPHSLFPLEDELEVHASAEPASFFAEIVFDRPMDHAYTYAVPDRLAAHVAVGKRVEAPFGKGDRATPGFCVRVASEAPTRAVKAIIRVLDDEALVDDHLMKLTRWIADYYRCGWGQVLHAVVPAGVRENAGTRQAIFIEALRAEQLPNPLPTVSPQQKTVLDRLKHQAGPIEQGMLCRLVKCGPGVVSGLVRKGLVRKFTERVESSGGSEAEDQTPHPAIELNPDQQKAWEELRPSLAGGYHPYLLHGVTGSGKTEIYLRAIEEIVQRGKEAIVLVPEISLTPQTIQRFRGRCGNVAVLHSHLTDAERGAYWRRVAAGQVQVGVGARSAVFAPTRKLGLIVIDEEHEHTFKQESTPRYHARDVAVMRARLEDIPIVMGSATPSLESWHNTQKGSFTLLRLPQRVEDRPLPPVKLIDSRHEPRPPGKPSAIGPTLEIAIRQNLKARGQVILLLNRRGFSTHVHCPDCGHVAQCAHCDLALTFHRTRSALVCHYCGWETPPFQRCPGCSEISIRYQGLGTEKLQAEIDAKFPGFVCQRMDSDTMTRPGSHQKVLDAFRDGHIQILVGTQMIAKGLDFPNVTLVGVVNADTGLHLPDFRSAERTFQLLAQVAGRTGRGDKGGQVMVQTLTPEHPCIALAAQHAYAQFAGQELAHRKEHRYPPYERMARLIVRSENQEAAGKFADELAAAFQEAMKRAAGPVRLLGPAECPVFRLKSFYRFHFQVQSDSSGVLHDVIRTVLAIAKPPGGVEFQVDVDPYNML